MDALFALEVQFLVRRSGKLFKGATETVNESQKAVGRRIFPVGQSTIGARNSPARFQSSRFDRRIASSNPPFCREFLLRGLIAEYPQVSLKFGHFRRPIGGEFSVRQFDGPVRPVPSIGSVARICRSMATRLRQRTRRSVFPWVCFWQPKNRRLLAPVPPKGCDTLEERMNPCGFTFRFKQSNTPRKWA